MKISEFQGDYRWLSNFWYVRIYYEGMLYFSVENAYQATKTLDKQIRLAISSMNPGVAKRYARKIKLRSDWEEIKLDVMYHLLKQKFKHPHLQKQLLNTGNSELIEGNTWKDTFWGVCNGVGENMLGKLLMRVRSELRGK